MALIKTLLSVTLAALFVVSSQVAYACKGGINPTGNKDGNAILKAAASIKDGYYSLQNIKTGQFLYLQSKGNIIAPTKKGSKADNPTSQDIIWTFRQHPKTKFSSIRKKNAVRHEKCVSARWTISGNGGGCDDAATMWQCEIDNKKTKREVTVQDGEEQYDEEEENPDMGLNGTTIVKRYQPIREDKQLWVFQKVAGESNTFVIYALAHLFDMTPRCISNAPISGGTLLRDCKVNKHDSTMWWRMTRRRPKNLATI
ncbi:hypothetical protein BC936DRAFT_144114 [Jimgerdemannia flammicorona]|uniref:Uncharacterized protein n=2 Tax=Jimgerdemannia flammicorona TaxID=994334 RepID=A0A433PAW2_9FUNG|nr:hypothetical protein BC936DRAFT_144114 [Jimgerdemannia flammicorona]RUS14649.1 hypothetical protein BC938DRAFT_477286 [Jimgerdemannia flammicorona]